ncbi:MAG: FtsQ-type POTRA domain-containing protein [Myxococcales bacterium]|jgi:cell division protein FtsQ|nr:FtsQ-type POTRA domain-containing protein [Myxococcales bacterium]
MAKTPKNKRRKTPAQVRAAMRKGAVRVLKGLGVLCLFASLTALATVGGRALRDWLFTSPTFAIEAIELRGLVHAAQTDVLALSRIQRGENAFEIDLDESAQAIRAHPWIEDVQVRRRLPRRIEIDVVEHVAAALVDLRGLYYADEAGKAFKRVSAGDRVDLPILRGVSREAYGADPEASEALLREGIALSTLYSSSGLQARAPLSDIELDPVEGLTLRCGEHATAVRLGRGDYQQKLARLARIFDELARRGAVARLIRLDNRARPGWVAVQLDKASQALF